MYNDNIYFSLYIFLYNKNIYCHYTSSCITETNILLYIVSYKTMYNFMYQEMFVIII